MKKLLYLIILFSIQSYSQKVFKVHNLTNFTFEIDDITTDASGVYPQFRSKGTTVSIPPGSTYVLVNPANLTRFPFESPSSSPYIASWTRINPPNASNVFASNVAWLFGGPQVFKNMTFGVVGAGHDIISVVSPTVNGNGWTAIYDVIVDPNNPGNITYMITIM